MWVMWAVLAKSCSGSGGLSLGAAILKSLEGDSCQRVMSRNSASREDGPYVAQRSTPCGPHSRSSMAGPTRNPPQHHPY